MFAAAASFVLLPGTGWEFPGASRVFDDGFGIVAEAMRFGHGSVDPRPIEGLLGFCYAFHYLNWFSKTGAIGWHRVGKMRAILLVGAWSAISLCYLPDFRIGLLLSLPLSVAHVFLEFSLDAGTFRGLAPRVAFPRRS